jgi:uncharacterized protein YoxC
MTIKQGTINKALHGLLAASGLSVGADATTTLHGAAQSTGIAAAVVLLVTAAVSWASHSRKVQELADKAEREWSTLVTPGVVAKVDAVAKDVATQAATRRPLASQVAAIAEHIPDVDTLLGQVKATAEAANTRATQLEQEIAKPVTVDDIRPIVEKILLSGLRPTVADPPAPVEPAAVEPITAAPPTV